MRILQVTPFYTPSRGGSVMAPHNLIRALRARGHEVTVLTTDFELDERFVASIDGVEVVPFPCRARASLLLYSPAMGRWLRENLPDYDLVHAHNYRTYQNILVRKECLRSKTPYVLQAHGSMPSGLGKGMIKGMFDRAWGRRIVRDASGLIAVSELEAQHYVGTGASPSKVSVIPNIVRRRDASSPPGAFRSRVGAGDRKIVLFLGRINRLKGLPFLIESFSQVRSRSEAVLVIAGPDEEGHREELRAQASQMGLDGDVLFVDDVDDVASAYQDAAVLVYPSSYEVFGLVPFEALLCGTPVIVTEDTGCGEIVRKQECGLTVPFGNTDALSKAMEQSLSDPIGMRAMAERGRRFVEDELNERRVADRFEEAYARCVRDR